MANDFKERVYNAAPIALQNALITFQGGIFRHQRFSNKFNQYLKDSKERAEMNRAELELYQVQALNKFVTFAYEKSTYYKNSFDTVGFTPNSIQDLRDLKQLPILEKDDLRQHTKNIQSNNYNEKDLIKVFTSGTTGTPISVAFTKDDMQNRMAFLYRMLGRFDVKPFMKSVRFSGRALFPQADKTKVFWRMNYAGNQLLMSSYNLKKENFDHYLNKLKKFNPIFIDGYPSSIFIIAKYVNSIGWQGFIKPKLIMTTAETLEDYQREEIKKAFGNCAICNQYASSEGAPFITEDEYGDMVINIDTGVFEFVKQGTDIPAEEGDIAEMLVTSFTTHAYPLIRYRIGDTAILSKNRYAQSMNMPTVSQILGRQEDILNTPDKGYVGRLDTVFKAAPSSIVETQIVQTSPTTIQLNVVPDKLHFKPEHLNGIKTELIKRLGNVDIKVQYYEALPRGKNGKLRAVIRNKSNI